MTHECKLYYVVIVKASYICSVEAGPFISSDLAEFAINTLPDISKSCRYAVASHDVHLSIEG